MNLWECMTSLANHGENKLTVSMVINEEMIVDLLELLNRNIINNECTLPDQLIKQEIIII